MFLAGAGLDPPFLSVIGREATAYGRGVAPQEEAEETTG